MRPWYDPPTAASDNLDTRIADFYPKFTFIFVTFFDFKDHDFQDNHQGATSPKPRYDPCGQLWRIWFNLSGAGAWPIRPQPPHRAYPCLARGRFSGLAAVQPGHRAFRRPVFTRVCAATLCQSGCDLALTRRGCPIARWHEAFFTSVVRNTTGAGHRLD